MGMPNAHLMLPVRRRFVSHGGPVFAPGEWVEVFPGEVAKLDVFALHDCIGLGDLVAVPVGSEAADALHLNDKPATAPLTAPDGPPRREAWAMVVWDSAGRPRARTYATAEQASKAHAHFIEHNPEGEATCLHVTI